MHAEGYEALVLCTHCRPIALNKSVIGMQCVQRAV